MPLETDPFSKVNYLSIETSSHCNLMCSFCTRPMLEEHGLREPNYLSTEKLQTILDQFKNNQVEAVKFYGLSEPFLNPHYDQMVTVLREYFPSCFLIVATNLNYNIEKTKFLQTIPMIDMVYFSIDGTGELYEKIRTGASWKKLLTSLEKVKALVAPEVRKEKFHVNFTATTENYREIPKMYEIRDEYGLASVRINIVQNWDQEKINQTQENEDLLNYLRDFRADLKGVPDWNYDQCFWPHTGMMVDVEGNIRQCPINTTMDPIGNLFEKPAKEIYNHSEYYNELREGLQKNCPPASCSTCDYKALAKPLSDIFEGYQAAPQARTKD